MKYRFLRAAVIVLTVMPLTTACEEGVTDPHTASASMLSAATEFGPWSAAINIERASPGADASFNTPSLEGCPMTSRDGKTFYMASNRPGGKGGIDIWVSHRASTNDPWGPPANVGEPVNSGADDFCPTIDRDGHRFFFVSRRVTDASCGGADIYETRLLGDGTFAEPRNLGCEVNSAADEASPFPIPERGAGPVLYFSSTRPGLGAGGDIYRSESHGGVFGAPRLVAGLNTAADDAQPNLRSDGLEMFFYSTRADPAASGGPDLYSATRPSTSAPWSTPVNLGPQVNSRAGDTRPSLSWDGTTLYFGSARPESEANSADIYVTTRARLRGSRE